MKPCILLAWSEPRAVISVKVTVAEPGEREREREKARERAREREEEREEERDDQMNFCPIDRARINAR